MKQWGLKKISKRASLLALSGAFVLGLAACGHGGGGDSDTDDGDKTTISGSVSQGPISGAQVWYNGANTGALTEADGSFTITIDTPDEPIEITFVSVAAADAADGIGTIDTVTGEAPTFVPSTILYPSDVVDNKATLNANTLTTLITESAKAAAGGVIGNATADQLTLATEQILRNFGFGIEGIENFDPRTYDPGTLSAEDAAKLTVGFEGATEMVRRMKTDDLEGRGIIALLAQDMLDGVIDGLNDGVTVNADLAVSFTTLGNTIVNEINDGTFTIGDLGALTQGNMGAAFANVFANVNDAAALLAEVVKVTGTDAFKGKLAAFVAAKAAYDQAKADDPNATAADLAKKAGEAGNKASSFSINEDSIGLFDGGDMPVDTTASGPEAGLLTLTLDGTVDAMNLEALANGDDSAHTPSIDLWVTNMPTASGIAKVSMMLLDNKNGDMVRDAGERQIKVSFETKWTSDGANLTLIAPSTAKASYQTMTSTSATEATLANETVGSLLVTEAGNDVDSTKLKARIATLFSTGAGDSALKAALEGNMAAGDYAYSLKIIGLPMSDSDGKGFHTISGTFTAAE